MANEKFTIETEIARLAAGENQSFTLDSALTALEDGLVDPARVCGSDFVWEDFARLTADEIMLLDKVLGLRTTDDQVILASFGFTRNKHRYQQDAIRTRIRDITQKIIDSNDSLARCVLFYAIGMNAIDRDIQSRLERNKLGLLAVIPLVQDQNATRHIR